MPLHLKNNPGCLVVSCNLKKGEIYENPVCGDLHGGPFVDASTA